MRRLSFAALATVLVIVACNDTHKPSESTFKNAINQYLSTHGSVCVWVGQAFPINVTADQEKLATGTPSQMQVLEAASLVHSTETTASIPHILGKTTQEHVKSYEPTPTGTTYLQQRQGPFGSVAGFCHGEKAVDSIVKWTEPTTFGPIMHTEVTYTYKIFNLAPWAQRADIQNEFRDVGEIVNGSSKTEQTVPMQLTNRGWEVSSQ